MLRSPDIARSGPVAPKRLTQAFVAVAVLVFALGGSVLFLLQTRIHTLQKSARDKEAQVGSNEQVAQRYQATLEEYNQTLSHIQFLESSVSQKSYVPTLLQQLQRLAQANHLTVTAVRPAPAAPPPPAAPGEAAKKKVVPPYDMLDIAVDVTGTYPDTATLLYSLTRFPKIISVASAQMRPASVPGRSPLAVPVVTTNLHLTAFVFREDPAAGAFGKPGLATEIAASPAAGGAATGIAGGALGGTAAHAVGRALGADKAARERTEAGVSTL